MPQKPTTAASRSPQIPAGMIHPLHADETYAAAHKVLGVLTHGLSDIERELVCIRVGDFLRRNPNNAHAAAQQTLLKRHREAIVSEKKARGEADSPIVASTDLGTPPQVVAALALLKSGLRPERPNREKQISQLEDDAVVVRAGMVAQQQIISALRGAASVALAARLREQHRALVLAHFRSAQGFAASADDLRKFRSDILASGHEFCGDLLPEPSLRSALILGSESLWNSEITSTRLLLEKLGIL